MNKENNDIPNYFIEPGYIYFPARQTKISAVLGSCVAVSLYDNKKKIGGMTHFLYPSKEEEQSRSIFGDVSVKALVNMFLKKGSKKKYMEAQIFGGAYAEDVSPKDIGLENVSAAKKILTQENIKIASEDIGGKKGRKIVFDTFTNEVIIIKVEKLRQSDWFPYNENISR